MASPTAQRRRRKREGDDGDPEFQVAPMVDVLLVLMLFFMSITSTEMLKKEKNLQLADADHAKQDKDKKNKPNELVVNVTWQNDTAGFSMDGIKYPSADALQAVLAARREQNPQAYVLIRADRDVEYSNISDLMTACASAGIGTVTFAVISGGGKSKPPAPADGTAAN
jgi:biopolymer transport protein ExbD